MKHFFYHSASKFSANITIENKPFLIREIPPNLLDRIKHNIVSADNIDSAISQLGATLIQKDKKLRSLTKRELVDRLIERDLATAFSAILESLPLEEKLRYDASPTISPDYAYIAENMSEICSALDISEEQFKDIFR